MTQFALLLHHSPNRYQNLTEDAAMSIFKDYMSWMQSNMDSGVCSGGYKLTDDGSVSLSSKSGDIVVHERSFADMAEILGGLMLIEAADIEAAVTIAKSHPHLTHNDHIEIRQLAS